MASAPPPLAASGAAPVAHAQAAPAIPHHFTRVAGPGLDPQADFMAVSVDCKVVQALPHLGWKDSSAVAARTVRLSYVHTAKWVACRVHRETWQGAKFYHIHLQPSAHA